MTFRVLPLKLFQLQQLLNQELPVCVFLSVLAAVLCYKSHLRHFWSHVILNRSRNPITILTSYVVVNDVADIRKKTDFAVNVNHLLNYFIWLLIHVLIDFTVSRHFPPPCCCCRFHLLSATAMHVQPIATYQHRCSEQTDGPLSVYITLKFPQTYLKAAATKRQATSGCIYCSCYIF